MNTRSMETKLVIGGIATLMGLIGYYPYLRDTILGRTKPHAFSWLVWALLLGIGFAVQSSHDAGPGAWAIALETVLCTLVFILALFKGEREIVLLDWMCLVGALIGIALWIGASAPLAALILVMLIDILGFVPTVRKAFNKPFEETASSYAIIGGSFLLSLFAVTSSDPTAWVYTAFLAGVNIAFPTYVMLRRFQTKTI